MSEYKCEYCGKVGPDVKYIKNPYNSEILDDDTLHWLCEQCESDSLMEI